MKNDDILQVAKKLKIAEKKIPLSAFQKGFAVELEHGKVSPKTNVTNNNPIKTGKIALAHLLESKDYYSQLAKMEKKTKRGVKKGRRLSSE